MALEDFTTWSEVDTWNYLTVYTNSISAVNQRRAPSSAVEKDFGAGFFTGEIDIEFEFIATQAGTFRGPQSPVFLSNILPSTEGASYSNNSAGLRIGTSSNASQCYIDLFFKDSSGTYTADGGVFPINSTRYMRFHFDPAVGTHGTFYLYAYTDAGRTTLDFTLSVAATLAVSAFRYLGTAKNNNDGDTGTDHNFSSTTSDLEVIAPGALSLPDGVPSITAIDEGNTSIDITYTTTSTNATGAEYRLDGGTWTTLDASPATISGLSNNTAYDLELRDTNGDGEGTASDTYEVHTGPFVAENVWELDAVSGSQRLPNAVMRSGKLFYGFHKHTDGDTYVGMLEGSTFTEVKVDTLTNQDAHNTAAVFIDDQDTVWTTYGRHQDATSIVYRKSASPLAIDFGSEQTAVNLGTDWIHYPKICQTSNGRIWIFIARADSGRRDIEYTYTDDYGVTWASMTKIFQTDANQRSYFRIWCEGGDIHVAMTRTNSADVAWGQSSLYWMKYTGANARWEKADGTAHTLPATTSTADKIFDAATYTANAAGGLPGTHNGDPVVLISSRSDTTVFHQYLARYSGGSWSLSTIQSPVPGDMSLASLAWVYGSVPDYYTGFYDAGGVSQVARYERGASDSDYSRVQLTKGASPDGYTRGWHEAIDGYDLGDGLGVTWSTIDDSGTPWDGDMYAPFNALAIEASVDIGIAVSATPSANAVLEAAASFAASQSAAAGNNATLNAVQVLAVQHGIDLVAVATLSAVISFGLNEGMVSDGAIATGPQTIEAALSVGVVQSIDAISVANLYAATALGSQFALTTAGGSDIEAAISFAIQQAHVQTLEISIEGAVAYGIQQAMSGSAQADLEASTTLAHQVGLQAIANAVLNAGLGLSAIQSVTTNGFTLIVGLTTPDGRTITIRAEDRTITIQ